MLPFLVESTVFILLLIAISVASIGIIKENARLQREKKQQELEYRRKRATISGDKQLPWFERQKKKILYNLEVIHMPLQVFEILLIGAIIIGFVFGKIILTKTELAIFMSLLFGLLPITFIAVRSNWYKQHEMALLESCMVSITTSYRSNRDIVKSVKENIDKASTPVAFKTFLSEVTFVDSSIEKALKKVGASFSNKYFSEWIEVLIKSQYDSNMMDILPVIIDEMDSAKRAQKELGAAMSSVWREYIIWVVTCVCVPLVLRLNAQWYSALVDTPIGKGLVIALLVFLANTLREMVKISKSTADMI